MRNTRHSKLINLRITPIAFKFQIKNDMVSINRGRLRKKGQSLTHATNNLITTHTK